MRLVSFETDKGIRPGALVGEDQVLDLAAAFDIARNAALIEGAVATPISILDLITAASEGSTALQTVLANTAMMAAAISPFSSVKLVSPIPRPTKNVFCVGSNYRAHVTEANRAQAKADTTPKLPVFFTKPPTAVIGPNANVRLDPTVSEKMDYEVELGVIIGKAGVNIKAEDALDHIFGFTIINDVTARDLQRAHGGQYLKGKGLDTTCPMGPLIVTRDELPNFEELRISLRVNDELRQDGNTGNMIFPIATLIESLSQGLSLEPGDILATGTPSGVGYAMDPPIYLRDGDKVECEIESIGQLTNFVRNSESTAFAA